MSDVLIKYDGNWADEMDLQGFLVMTREEWDTYLALVKKRFGENEFEICIGTNESVTFANFEDYKESFEIKKLSDEEAKTFRKFFKTTLTLWDPSTKKNIKLNVAMNGLVTMFESSKWQWDDMESENEESEEEDVTWVPPIHL